MSPSGSDRRVFDVLGFADREGAKRVAHRRQLIRDAAMRQTAPSKFLDIHIEKDGRPRVLPGEQAPPLSRYHHSVIAQCAIERIRCDDVGHHELLQAVKSILEFVELVLGDFGHDGDSAVDAGSDGTGEALAPHRFDGGAK